PLRLDAAPANVNLRAGRQQILRRLPPHRWNQCEQYSRDGDATKHDPTPSRAVEQGACANSGSARSIAGGWRDSKREVGRGRGCASSTWVDCESVRFERASAGLPRSGVGPTFTAGTLAGYTRTTPVHARSR